MLKMNEDLLTDTDVLKEIETQQDLRLLGIVGIQNNKKVITGVFTAEEFLETYDIDIWRPGVPIEKQGCQRPPIQAHYRKLARRLKDPNAWLPTSVVMSVNIEEVQELNRIKIVPLKITKEISNALNIDQNKLNRLVMIIIPKGTKLRLSDGQHRALALNHAIATLGINRLKQMELPFVLMLVSNRIEEIMAFYEINSTAKKVSTDLSLQLLNELKEHQNRIITKTESWKLVALNVSMALNEHKSPVYLKNELGQYIDRDGKPLPKKHKKKERIIKEYKDSVWKNNISIGRTKEGEIASSTSFVMSLKPILDIPFISSIWNNTDDLKEAGKRIADFVDNFWNALRILLPSAFPEETQDKNNFTIQKTPGFFIWNRVAAFVVTELMIKREKITDFGEKNIAAFLQEYLNNEEYLKLEFWLSSNKLANVEGGRASTANSQKAFKDLADEICDVILLNYEDSQESEVSF